MAAQTDKRDDQAAEIATGADAEVVISNQRQFVGNMHLVIAALCIVYTAFHLWTMNVAPLETWIYRLSHVAGGLALAFLVYSARIFGEEDSGPRRRSLPEMALTGLAGAGILYAAGAMIVIWATTGGQHGTGDMPPEFAVTSHGIPLVGGTVLALFASWLFPETDRSRLSLPDLLLAIAAITVAAYLIYYAPILRMRAGTAMAQPADMYAAIAGVLLIMEVTRRLTGNALVIIVGVFVVYSFVGPWLPGLLNHRGYSVQRFFTYIYTDNGILGPTTAVSSTYIILFITFAAFLQATRVGEYFINFAFAAAGGSRGGPAKVAIFGSGLMGMINGTSAGNVVSTGSLTIPLMKKVGYRNQTSAAIEAAASSGGQILPPIMGAGAFIMAEITGIRYTEIVIAAVIPALLYFASVYFMVDKEALRLGMRGLPRADLPKFREMAKRAYLFIPIVMLIGALYVGYSVIRAGTYAMLAAFVVSYLRVFIEGREDGWLNHLIGLVLWVIAAMPIYVLAQIAIHGMAQVGALQLGVSLIASAIAIGAIVMSSRGETRLATAVGKTTEHFRMVPYALEIAARMSLQLVAVCAAAGVIVGVIALTGVGSRFASMLLGLAANSQLLALFFAMCVSIILGMGMPTTAAYAVAASVIAPGLVRMGIEPLTAHFFVFYFAVMSAITPPVALAAYAGAAISGSDPLKTSVESFKIGLAAFVVPFMFFYSSPMLMQGEWYEILHVAATALLGIFLLASAVQAWLFGLLGPVLRIVLLAGAVAMIQGGWISDIIGLAVGGLVFAVQKLVKKPEDLKSPEAVAAPRPGE